MSAPTAQTHTRQVDLNNESVTGHAGEAMLQRSGILKTSPTTRLRILDNASGAGGLLFRLFDHLDQLPLGTRPKLERVVAGDLNSEVLASIPRRIHDENRNIVVETMTLDQQKATALPDAEFTHVFSNFGAFFAADENAVFSETLRLLRPGGSAGFTSWRSTAWPDEVLFPALKAHLPEAPALPHPGKLFGTGWNDANTTREKLVQAAFVGVDVSVLDFTPDLAAEVEEWAESLSMLTSMLAAKAWSKDQYAEFVPKIKPALIRYLRENFKDGKWDGTMSAIIALGKKAA